MIHWKELGTQGRIDAIRQVWFSGCSTRQLAANFEGATRNAVIGMYSRFGETHLADRPLRSKLAVGVGRKSKKRRAPVTFLFADKTSKPLPSPVEIAFEHRICGKPLMMLNSSECRFPVNDASGDELHLFCALPADGSYCHHHKARAHQPASERSR